MNQWISALFAIIGVVVGSLLSYFAGLHIIRIENQWKRDEAVLKKFEELYTITEDIKIGFFKTAGFGIAKAHYNTPIKEHEIIPITKLKALIDFYAPEAKNHFTNLEAKRHIFGEHYAKVLLPTALSKQEAQVVTKNLLEASDEIDKVCTEIQECILEISRSLRVARGQ